MGGDAVGRPRGHEPGPLRLPLGPTPSPQGPECALVRLGGLSLEGVEGQGVVPARPWLPLRPGRGVRVPARLRDDLEFLSSGTWPDA